MNAPPALDARSYDELREEVVARIPVHNPQWTNYGRSDPGVTILELFAFIAESVAYRADQVPERNRRRFLSLLGVPRSPGATARGLVVVANARGPLERSTLSAGLEVRAGRVPFRTERGLDVLPVDARAFVKRTIDEPDPGVLALHQQLYASYRGEQPSVGDLKLYETVPVDGHDPAGAALQASADGSLWIALLLRESDPPDDAARAAARRALAGATLSLGIVPVLDAGQRRLAPASAPPTGFPARLDIQIPKLPPGGILPPEGTGRRPQYRSLPAVWSADVLAEPGIIDVTLPDAGGLELWANLDPLEAGVGDFPPSLEDSKLAARVLTWLRLKAAPGTAASLLWAGINAVTVDQREHVASEALPNGNGEPGQVARLARAPVVPGSLTLTVDGTPWREVDDLTAGGPELALPDQLRPPGTAAPPSAPAEVYVLDPAGGELRFGDGFHGRRPPSGSVLRAAYDAGQGAAGNVGADALAKAPALPAGMTVTNPMRTWGGADPATVAAAEATAARWLRHRDRAVTRDDFEAVAWSTPGTELARVDVLGAFSPELTPSVSGDAAGAVTVVVVPRHDERAPDAPEPDRLFLDAVCRQLDRARLVTTEVFVRGPTYRPIWVSVGIEVEAGRSAAVVREAVAARLRRFLAPVDPDAAPWWDEAPISPDQPFVHAERGWPLGAPVVRLELMAVANRVVGVRLVRDVVLADGSGGPVEQVPLGPLELPRLLQVTVAEGVAPDLDEVRGVTPPSEPPPFMPVPVIPETC